MPLLRASGLDGVPQLRGSWGHWPWRPRRRSHRSRTKSRGTSPFPMMTASSTPASRHSMRSSDPAGSRSRPASRSAATVPAAGPRSPCVSSRRPRRRARSWPGSTSRAASTRSRRSPAAFGSSGSSSSRRQAWTRVSRSRARSWPAARSTCSCSTCPAVDWPRPTSRPRSPIVSIDSPRSPVGRRSCS